MTETSPAAPVTNVDDGTDKSKAICLLPILCCHFKKLFSKDKKSNSNEKSM